MQRSFLPVLRYKAARVLTFGIVTLVCALLFNAYARLPFDPLMLSWGLFGLLIGMVEQFFFTGRIARAPVYAQLLLRIVIIWVLAMGTLSVLIMLGWIPLVLQELDTVTLGTLWERPVGTGMMIKAVIVSAAVMLIMEMERLVGTRMFRRLLVGRYLHPKREVRVVMFIDVAGSTTLTEQLGDERYFRMLNETFERMTAPILRSGAEVLKYVGDEMILTWEGAGGLREARCLDLFFDIHDAIKQDRAQYQRVYGVVPRFRAGVHRGEVITAQIGVIKRSIDHSGDAMNTCARLAHAARDHGDGLLVSRELLDAVGTGLERFQLGEVTSIEVRGRQRPVEVVVVERRDP